MARTQRQLIDDLLRAWNDHDLDRAEALFAHDYHGVDVGAAGPQRGPAGMRSAMARYLDAFPDLHVRANRTVIQRNNAAVAWTARATHRGKFMNIPATGRKVVIQGVSVLTLRDGKIARGLHVWDVAGLLRAMGLLPELQPKG